MLKKFLEIVELVAQVSRYLEAPDLFACVQVSSQWHRAFIPSLWHTIDDTTHSWNFILWQCGDSSLRAIYCHGLHDSQIKDSDQNKDRQWLLHVFHKYGRHIRDISIHWPMTLEAVSISTLLDNSIGGSGCNTLRSLTLGINGAPGPFFSKEGQVLSSQRSQASMPTITMSAPLFPSVIDECDYFLTLPLPYPPEFRQEQLETLWVLAQHYLNILFHNHNLVRLILRQGVMLPWEGSSKHMLYKVLARQTQLKEITGWKMDDLSDIWQLLEASPTLETLTVDCRQHKLPAPLPEVAMTLRSLSLNVAMSINGLLDILSLFPNLFTLTLPTIGSLTPEAQRQPRLIRLGKAAFLPEHVLPRDRPIVTNLRVLDVKAVGDYDTLLQHLPDHVEVTFYEGYAGPYTGTLPEHSTRFGVYKAERPPWYISEKTDTRRPHDPANQLLVSSSRLRVFDSIEHYIHVDEMLRQPWACMGLEWLSCRIVGVDRLNDAEQSLVDRVMAHGYAVPLSDEERAAVEKFQRCRAQHHGVYDRLASLTKLKHLDLGYENRYPWQYKSGDSYEAEDGEEYLYYGPPTFDTLELSLASGVDRLGALKNLEMIGFECINHRIGRAELEWMAKSWPKLNLMYGLDEDRLTNIEPNLEKALLKDYFQQLRPEVVHDSLFEDNF